MSSGDPIQFGRVPFAHIDAGAAASMKPADLRVYVVLCAHADHEWSACIGMRRIARLAGIHIGTASAAVGRLKVAGLIQTNNPGNGAAYRYRIVADRSAPAERSTVQHTPNDAAPDRSAHDEGTVQRTVKNRSARAEQNRENRGGTERARTSDNGQADAVVMNMPTKAGTDWPLYRSKVAELAETFPGIDIEAEARKARQWLRDNPDRRKTPRGMPRFLSGWMSRANPDRNGDGQSALDADPVEPPDEVFTP